ncbi:MAG: hypothetical protein GY866_11870 [Proteobacteria bacterium]|nr:hypothetical protein [Pseudomonadota bacterium]
MPQVSDRVQCRHCHLTIKKDELGSDYCPECFEAAGKKNYEFVPLESQEPAKTRYRCEDCGGLIETQ